MVIEGNSAKTIKGFIAINEFYGFIIINYSGTILKIGLFYNKNSPKCENRRLLELEHLNRFSFLKINW